MGTGTYLLDKEHLPIYPDFEDNTVVMDENQPSSVHAQAKEKAKAEKAARMPTTEEASQYLLKSKQDHLGYLIASTLRIEKGLSTLTQNQENLERIVEQKFYDLDVKVTEIQSVVEQLQDEVQEKKVKSTTDAFAREPRGQRSAAVPVTDTRGTSSAPPATASVPPAPATSIDAFVHGVLSTPPPGDQA